MKKTALIIMICTFAVAAAGCKKEGVSLIKVTLRDNPSKVEGGFSWVKTINRGQVVNIEKEQTDGDWYRIVLPDGTTTGWVEKRFIHKGKKEIIEFTDTRKLYDQPDQNSKVVYTITPGKKGIVLRKKDNWINVSIAYNLNGWVQEGDFVQSDEAVSETGMEVSLAGIGTSRVEVSSFLEESSGYTYNAANLFDKNPGTTWQEGKGDAGIGEWVEVTFPDPVSVSVSMINGFAKKDPRFAKYGEEGDLYVLNNRVKSMRVEYTGADGKTGTRTISLEDKRWDLQDAGIYDNVKKLRFIIESVYKGSKWNDTAVAELQFNRI